MSRSNAPALRNPGGFPCLGVGIGLRPTHYNHVLENKTGVPWFEAISENYMGLGDESGGRPIQVLERLRRDHAIVLHGVSLSIGSTDPLDRHYLEKLKGLVGRIEPAWISDHLCWTSVEGEHLHDLLPLPYTEETLQHLVPRIQRVQDFLGRRILLENVSSYLTYKHAELKEWDFLRELCRRADCAVLLDINNIYVSAVNQHFDPMEYLNAIPPERVGQMHLAGYSDQGSYLLDTHNHPVAAPVWSLYRSAVQRFGAVSTLIEWDASIPDFSVLEAEASSAHAIQMDELRKEVGLGAGVRQPVST